MKRMLRFYNLFMFYSRIKHGKFVLALVVLLMLFSFLTHAQSFDWFKIFPLYINNTESWEDLPEGLTAEMMNQLIESPYITSEFPITIFPKDGEFYALFSCRFEVLKWTGNEWINLYKGSNSGFNCKAHFYQRNGKFYSVGRYGFWASHSQILEFDFKNGYWENIHVKNIPNFHEGSYIFVSDQNIFSFLGRYIHQGDNTRYYEENGFSFDFGSKTWRKLNLDLGKISTEILSNDYSYDLKDYGIGIFFHDSDWGALVFDKKNLTFYFLELQHIYLNNLRFVYGLENNFYVLSNYKVRKKDDLFHINFNPELLDEALKIGKVKESPWWYEFKYNSLYFTFIVSISFLILWVSFRKKLKINRFIKKLDIDQSKLEIQTDDVVEIEQAIEVLLNHTNKVFDVLELDEILKLDEIRNMDYRRVRRSRVVKAVNDFYFAQNGRVLIERVKSKEDRRLVFFKINGLPE